MSNPSGSRAVVPPRGYCINPQHRTPCWVCKLPSSREKDRMCTLVDHRETDEEPGSSLSLAAQRPGIDKLRRHIEGSSKWNSWDDWYGGAWGGEDWYVI